MLGDLRRNGNDRRKSLTPAPDTWEHGRQRLKMVHKLLLLQQDLTDFNHPASDVAHYRTITEDTKMQMKINAGTSCVRAA